MFPWRYISLPNILAWHPIPSIFRHSQVWLFVFPFSFSFLFSFFFLLKLTDNITLRDCINTTPTPTPTPPRLGYKSRAPADFYCSSPPKSHTHTHACFTYEVRVQFFNGVHLIDSFSWDWLGIWVSVPSWERLDLFPERLNSIPFSLFWRLNLLIFLISNTTKQELTFQISAPSFLGFFFPLKFSFGPWLKALILLSCKWFVSRI